MNSSKLTLPGGPATSPWEQARAWIENPIEFWTKCQRDYGDTFKLEFGSLGTTVLFCHPESVRQIFALPPQCYECRSFNEHYRFIMGDRSLLVLDGDDHLQQRKLLLAAFPPSERSKWITSTRNIIRKKMDVLHSGSVVQIRKVIHEAFFEVTLQILFQQRQPPIRSILSRLFADVLVKEYGTWSPWARFAKMHSSLRRLIAAETEELRSQATTDEACSDIFRRLALLRSADNRNFLLSDEQIADHIFTMLVAGVDPSAIAMSWAIHWIVSTPGIQQSLQQEFRGVADSQHYLLSTDSFLHAVCQESLRMYPVVTTPSGRKLLDQVVVDDREYAPGVTLVPCTYLVHRRPEIFKNPNRFDPNRFFRHSFSSYQYFPFGGGSRRCIGASFSLTTIKAALYEIFNTRQLRPATGAPVVPVRHGTLLAPSDNLSVIFRMYDCR